ncbi:MAG: SDR family NAD(P)-dependent oxidoreductase [Candidatus Rokubacteria bacterium]|nr:SDR family NAD(P)-dependent oxidoreductase [Candidatus Rokubacteria bacterium]
MLDLAGQVAWVTGGGTGLGRGAAEALARHGATVVVSGRRSEALDEAVRVIRSAGGVAHSLVCDVARTGDVRAAAASLGDRFGRLDILVTSAGINRRGPALEYAEEAWDEVFATNLKGCFSRARRPPSSCAGGAGARSSPSGRCPASEVSRTSRRTPPARARSARGLVASQRSAGLRDPARSLKSRSRANHRRRQAAPPGTTSRNCARHPLCSRNGPRGEALGNAL